MCDEFDLVVLCDANDFSEDTDFYDLLTEDVRKELGEINPSWFDEAFSETPSPVTKQNGNLTVRNEESIDLSEAIGCRRRFSGESQDSSAEPVSPPRLPLVFGFSPLTNELQTMSRSGRGCYDSPGHIALSLGASIGGHEMSWTSAMETPRSNYPELNENKWSKLSESAHDAVVDDNYCQGKSDGASVDEFGEAEIRQTMVTESPKMEAQKDTFEECKITSEQEFLNTSSAGDDLLSERRPLEEKLDERSCRERSREQTSANVVCQPGILHPCENLQTNESTQLIDEGKPTECFGGETTPKLQRKAKFPRRRMIGTDGNDDKLLLSVDQSKVICAPLISNNELVASELGVNTATMQNPSDLSDVDQCNNSNIGSQFCDRTVRPKNVAITDPDDYDSHKNIPKAHASDHDYAKPLSPSPSSERKPFVLEKELCDDYDSHNLNGFTQLMEVVDSTAAYLAAMDDETFTQASPIVKTRLCIDEASDLSECDKKQFLTDSIFERTDSEAQLVDVGNRGMNSETSSLDTCLKSEKWSEKPRLPLSNKALETQDNLFWDPEFPESEQYHKNSIQFNDSENDFLGNVSDFDKTFPANCAELYVTPKIRFAESENRSRVVCAHSEVTRPDNSETNCPQKTNSFQGFVTAGGKSVNVSKESLEKARNAYDSFVLEVEFQEGRVMTDGIPLDNQEQITEECKGFSTASGKPVKISEKSLDKARQLHYEHLSEMQKLDSGHSFAELAVEQLNNIQSDEKRRDRGGTAIGSAGDGPQSVPSFNESTIHPLRSSNDVTTESVDKEPPDLNRTKFVVTGNIGFSTASGKNVSVSKKALERARLLHKEDLDQICQEEMTANNVGKSVSKLRVDNFDSPIVGFSTASGKTCLISDESLQKAKKLFESDLMQIDDKEFDAGDEKTTRTTANVTCESNVRGVKRPLDLTDDTTSERASKASFRSCSSTIRGNSLIETDVNLDNRSVTDQKTETSNAEKSIISISKDSMDAAEALLAMAYSHHGHPNIVECRDVAIPTRTTSILSANSMLTPFKSANEKPVQVSSQSFEFVTASSPFADNCTPDFCRDRSFNDLSAEILESTAALLEDELETSSKDSKLFEPSVARNCLERTYSRRTDSQTPMLSKNFLASNCKRVLCDSMTNDILRTTCLHDVTVKLQTDREQCGSEARGARQYDAAPSLAADIVRRRKEAIDEQLLRIAKKSTVNTVPVTGELYRKKADKCNRISLRKLVGGVTPRRVSDDEALRYGIRRLTLRVRSSNAKEFCFSFDEHFSDLCDSDVGIVELEDGAVLILNERNLAGKEEFYRSLVDCPGVDPKLVSKEWVFNHYRWIVWKLASLEVAFPHRFAGRCLTPVRVMSELRYRVNHEIDCSQRSTLKRITERDDTAMKTMILCVASIRVEDCSETSSKNSIHLEVTDGWYSVIVALDKPLMCLVKRGKIRVGQKLIVHGAETVCSGEACPPLEVPNSPILKFSYNSCRLARFDAKLGFFRSPQPFPLPLSCLSLSGGVVGRVDVVIARMYPLQFLEKRHDGSFVVYNAKMNDLVDRGNENEKINLLDRLVTDVQSKLEREESKQVQKYRTISETKNFTREYVMELCGGEEIAKGLQSAADPNFFQSCLSDCQKVALIAYNEKVNEKRQARLQSQLSRAIQMRQEDGQLPAERNVVPFLKVRAVGLHEKDRHANTTCFLTIWRPSEGLKSILKEGTCMQIYYLSAEHRSKELALKTTKMSKFEAMSSNDYDASTSVYVPRKFTPLFDMSSPEFKPAYGDVDIVGIIVSVGNVGWQPGSKFEVVYIANASHEIIGIKFWGGRKAFGFESVLEAGAFIVAHNLHWRGREKSVIPCVHASEQSVFTLCPKDRDTKHVLDALQLSITNVKSFSDCCKGKIDKILQNECLSPTVPSLLRHGQPKCTSTPLYNRSNVGSALRDPILCKMKQLQNLSGVVPQLNALPSPNSGLVYSEYKAPLLKGCTESQVECLWEVFVEEISCLEEILM